MTAWLPRPPPQVLPHRRPMSACTLPRAATFNQAWDNLHHWRCFLRILIEDCLCVPVPPFSPVGQPFRAPESQPGGIVCDTLVIHRVSDIACRTCWGA